MALERIGLGGVLTFDSAQAVRGMRAAQTAAKGFSSTFASLPGRVRQFGQGLGQASAQLRGAALAATPLTLAVGGGVAVAASFEKQMSAVQAISGATGEDFAKLTAKAKELGASTSFTAREAAAGMEFFARAGFDTTEVLSGIGPVLRAAEADGIDLATSANIVSNTLKGMGLEANQAGRVADVLATTSAKTNTDMIGLGEGFKFAAAQAKTMGIDLNTTAAALGAAADAGLKGTLGGTSFTNMLVKLSKPSGKAKKFLEDFNIEMTKTADGGLDIVDVVKQVNTALKDETDVIKKAQTVTELFGIRGQKAFSAIAASIESGKFGKVQDALAQSAGSAEKMAKIRLDNLAGAMTILKSAAEGFILATASLFTGDIKEGVQAFTDDLQLVVKVIEELNSETGLTTSTAVKAGPTIVGIAQGIKLGIEDVRKSIKELGEDFQDVAAFFGADTKDAVQSFARLAVKIVAVGAALGPILIGLAGVSFVGSQIVGLTAPMLGFAGAVTKAALAFGRLALFGNAAAKGAKAALAAQAGLSALSATGAAGGAAGAAKGAAATGGIVGALNAAAAGTTVFGAAVSGAAGVAAVLGAALAALAGVALAADQAIKLYNEVTREATLEQQAYTDMAMRLIQETGSLTETQAQLSEAMTRAAARGDDAAVAMLNVASAAAEAAAEMRAIPGTIAAAVREAKGEQIEEQITKPALASVTLGATVAAQKFLAKEAAGEKAAAKRKAAKGGGCVDLKLTDGRSTNINNKLSINSRELVVALSEVKQEVSERSGFKATPWQRRIILEQGAAPVGGLGGGVG